MPGLHLTLAIGDPKLADDLVRLSNDGLAEFVTKYPDRFKGFAGLLPMYDPDKLNRTGSAAEIKCSRYPDRNEHQWRAFR